MGGVGMHRTQIYLEDDQRRALKQLGVTTDESMSVLIRRAVNRLLAEEFGGDTWRKRVDALAARVRARGGHSEVEIAAAVRRVRARKRRRTSVS